MAERFLPTAGTSSTSPHSLSRRARPTHSFSFAATHHPEYFDLDWVEHSPLADEYHRMVETVCESVSFMENVLGVRAGESDRIDFFTAHEALHLGYESAQTRRVPRRPGFFNLTT